MPTIRHRDATGETTGIVWAYRCGTLDARRASATPREDHEEFWTWDVLGDGIVAIHDGSTGQPKWGWQVAADEWVYKWHEYDPTITPDDTKVIHY